MLLTVNRQLGAQQLIAYKWCYWQHVVWRSMGQVSPQHASPYIQLASEGSLEGDVEVLTHLKNKTDMHFTAVNS